MAPGLGGAGLRFGLNVPTRGGGDRKRGPAGAVGGDSGAGAAPPAFTFAALDDSDDEAARLEAGTRYADVGAAVRRQADATDARARAEIKRVLAEDPSAFVYDDGAEEEKGNPLEPAAAVQRESKYISGMLATAKRRAADSDLAYERRARKEAKLDDKEFAGKERFVTASYRKKLEEEKKWLEDEAAAEARDAAKPHNAMAMRIELQQSARTTNAEVVDISPQEPKDGTLGVPQSTARAAEVDMPPHDTKETEPSVAEPGKAGNNAAAAQASDRAALVAAARARYLERRAASKREV